MQRTLPLLPTNATQAAAAAAASARCEYRAGWVPQHVAGFKMKAPQIDSCLNAGNVNRDSRATQICLALPAQARITYSLLCQKGSWGQSSQPDNSFVKPHGAMPCQKVPSFLQNPVMRKSRSNCYNKAAAMHWQQHAIMHHSACAAATESREQPPLCHICWSMLCAYAQHVFCLKSATPQRPLPQTRFLAKQASFKPQATNCMDTRQGTLHLRSRQSSKKVLADSGACALLPPSLLNSEQGCTESPPSTHCAQLSQYDMTHQASLSHTLAKSAATAHC
jgi:hypothetical protein